MKKTSRRWRKSSHSGIIIMLMLTAIAALLTACGSSGEANVGDMPHETAVLGDQLGEGLPDADQPAPLSQPPDDTPTEAPGEEAEAAFALDYYGFTIQMDQNMEEVLGALSEPLGIFEAPSCAFEGIDRIYRFPGMQIHTYPLGEEDFVHTISIRDDSIFIHGDIYMGNSWEDVTAVYGDGYEQDVDMFTYTRGSTTLSFLVEEGNVTAITFGLIMG